MGHKEFSQVQRMRNRGLPSHHATRAAHDGLHVMPTTGAQRSRTGRQHQPKAARSRVDLGGSEQLHGGGPNPTAPLPALAPALSLALRPHGRLPVTFWQRKERRGLGTNDFAGIG